ncbi:MAG: hypothetical protein NTW96_24530 [Planctomycetia bacterium]|nr:hypothetical protein [Planctomycetia bacterium]
MVSDGARELARLIDACVIAIQEDPGRTLFDRKRDFAGGLNAIAINAAAESIGLGPVFVLYDDGGRRSIEVGHPAGDPPVTWIVRDPVMPTRAWTDARLDRTVAALRAWREAAEGKRGTRRKRSTEPGEARAKIVAALTVWHKYENGGCGNTTPIGVNELARLADVGPASVNRFFNKQFGGARRAGTKPMSGRVWHPTRWSWRCRRSTAS